MSGIFYCVVVFSVCVVLASWSTASVHIPSLDRHGNEVKGHNDSGYHDNSSDTSGDPHHGGNDSSGHGHSRGIHVASFHFDYVEQPLTIAVFLLIAGVSKLGKLFYK